MHHHDRLVGVAIIGGQAGSQFRSGNAASPVARHIVHHQAEPLRELPPELRKMSGLKHQHAVAGR